MKRPPPVTILEFLERLGIVFNHNLYGQVNELYTRETLFLAPHVREVLPLIERELEGRAQVARGVKGTPAAAVAAPGPRLNQTRVTNFFRGINLVEAYVGEARWVAVGWVKRGRDGKKFAAQKLIAPASQTGD